MGPHGDSRNTETTTNMFTLILRSALAVSFVLGAPQYAGVQPSPVKVAPAPLTGGGVHCRTEYATIWDTEYTETETQVCTTEYEKVCRTETQRLCKPTTRQECHTVYEKQCRTEYKNVCVEQFKTEYEPYTETECSTEYKEDCEYQWEGHGNDKVWAPIAGTCKTNPYETCKDVSKTKERQVAYPVCHDVPEEICIDVPRQECVEVPDQVCTNQPLKKCQDVPRQACHNVHKKVPVRVSKQVPKKVCEHGTQQTHVPAHVPAVPAETFVPPFAGSGPEIIDTRNKDKNIQFQRNTAAKSETDNSIVFGD